MLPISLDALFPPADSSMMAFLPATLLAFAGWKTIYHLTDWPMRRRSRWYRSLNRGEQQFLRAYLVRCLWALQALYTSLRTLGFIRDPNGLFDADRDDKIHGWSRLYAPTVMHT